MRISIRCHALAGLAVALLCAPLVRAGGELAQGGRGIVATVHPLATDAALETFKNGGNAIDAAVAAALTLGIVDGHNSGIGGGCFMLIRLADGRFVAIDGRETAPAAAKFASIPVRRTTTRTLRTLMRPLGMALQRC